jgi:hypothetical protein
VIEGTILLGEDNKVVDALQRGGEGRGHGPGCA